MAYDAMQTSMNAKWVAQIAAIFQNNVPAQAQWRGADAIAAVLSQVTGSHTHMFFPENGGQDLMLARASRTYPGCLEWSASSEEDGGHRWAYVLNPDGLEFHNDFGKVEESYFLLNSIAMDPVEIFPSPSQRLNEEIVELPNGKFLSRSYWDAGVDMEGNSLPADARVLSRYGRGGKFALFCKGSWYNSNNDAFDAYDAIHTRPAEFKKVIEAIARL